jgi:outer membrane murein-binding lipoprotein Lpp
MKMLSRIMMGMFVLTVAVSLFGTAAWAGCDAKAYMEKLSDKLALTQEQKDKIAPVVQDLTAKAKANPDKAKEIAQEIKNAAKAHITPAQQEKLAKFKECD